MKPNPAKMNKLLRAAAVAIVSGAICGTSALAQDVTLRMHQFLPVQASVPKNVLQPWMDRIEAESDGRIKFQHFPSMQLGGKPTELYDQVVDGVADVVWTLPGYTPGRFPRTEVFELPFMMTDAVGASKAYWTLGEETMMDTDFKDVKVLGLWVHGPGVIHSKKPITSLESLDGVKLRAPTRITNQMFSALGATAVGMPVPAVPEALSKGVIDGAVVPWEITNALKTSELVSNHTEFGERSLYTATFLLAMNKDRYDALPDDLKAVIDANSGLAFSALAGEQALLDDVAPRLATIEQGNNVFTLPEEEQQRWFEAASGTVDSWIAEMDEKGLDGTGLYQRAVELISEHSAN